ncbi:Z1 domain-containing protein [Bosea vaviloviae]|uniref:Beta-1,4-mannanase n=1 Tax=Bosea vaviloviae TaxID=1526658 RepID=A0A1D7TYX0_9HYPH|nr:Z1 domain-containing protein [Bosea vaviloviae]AOO80310.1 beta-1,4-mannanase [Bosea vaviloviae]
MTSTTQVEAFVRQLRARLPSAADIDDAARLVRQDLEPFLGRFSEENETDFAVAIEQMRASIRPVEILRVNSIFRTRQQWYQGPGDGDRHWPALRAYLIDSKDWSPTTVDERIGAASNEIVSLLEAPAQESFACRGLVIGHVQSGKTANMTAVIAKAVDAGYNLVIILAGLTNKLRKQTQGRMQKDLVDRLRDRWQLLTREDEQGDFRMPPNGGFPMPAAGAVHLAVVKKNVAPLGQLLLTIERTVPAILRRLKVLIIDDECDQASVNTASGEYDMTRINEMIRLILRRIPANSYVGYTATPFANVLINPFPAGGSQLDDLYPKDFITALPTPDGYFGTERLFGRPPVDADSPRLEEEGLDMIRDIPEADATYLQPPSRADKDLFQPRMPSSLEDAVLYFLASCAARRFRGDGGNHMSMLIHTSAYVIMHERLATLVKAWLEVNADQIVASDSPLARRMLALWDAEQARVPSDLSILPQVNGEQLMPFMPEVLDALVVPVENGVSEDRIDYDGPAKTYIVVGGSILARGLTIEGLCVSYFLRTSSQYDTLLQMGRWFGYRPRYEDMPRIWMTESLSTAFRSLALVEAEIRTDVEEYRIRRTSPTEFAVRVRSIPGMAITAASKMRAAVLTDMSYAGKHIQTIRFDHRDPNVVRGNWTASANLLTQLIDLGLRDPEANRALFRGVPGRLIVQFLRAYSVQASHRELSNEFLLGYIDASGDSRRTWNVGVVEPRIGEPSAAPLGGLGTLRLSNRTRLQRPEDFADIKALMSRRDVMFDWVEEGDAATSSDWSGLKAARADVVGDTPLLLLYPIDRRSTPRPGSRERVALDAVGDLIGFGIVFPGSVEGSGGYYSVRLEAPSADDLQDIEDEVAEQLEAGRVH